MCTVLYQNGSIFASVVCYSNKIRFLRQQNLLIILCRSNGVVYGMEKKAVVIYLSICVMYSFFSFFRVCVFFLMCQPIVTKLHDFEQLNLTGNLISRNKRLTFFFLFFIFFFQIVR